MLYVAVISGSSSYYRLDERHDWLDPHSRLGCVCLVYLKTICVWSESCAMNTIVFRIDIWDKYMRINCADLPLKHQNKDLCERIHACCCSNATCIVHTQCCA